VVLLRWRRRRRCFSQTSISLLVLPEGVELESNVRGKVTAFSCQDGDVDIFHNRDFLHQFGKAEVMVSIECVQLLWQIEGDDGDVASGLQRDFLLDLRHC
jgi:hypothetical protein